tara:strand:- start:713 stop:1153 length:441 start_codon:yes stop_codon:yes gene_type:complete
MSIRFQRLIIILFSLTLLTVATTLILINSKKNLIFFFTPSELFAESMTIDTKIRVGGFVKKDSFKKNQKENNYNFIITDNKNEINIEYTGILPDLFKEENGAVIEGILINKNKILASKVFAKHDENYMPSSIKKQLEKEGYWNKNY